MNAEKQREYDSRPERMELHRRRQSAWVRSHKAEQARRAHVYYVKYRDIVKARVAAYKARNLELVRARDRRWKKAHHAEVIHAVKQRRLSALQRGTYSRKEWLEKLDLFAHRCAYCGVDGKLTVDHRVPLSCGGGNTIANVVPACSPCNLRKFRKTDLEFIEMRRVA